MSYYSRFCAFCVWYGFNSSYYTTQIKFANICYTVPCIDYFWTKCFKNCKNISTVMSKIKVASFLGHGILVYRIPGISQLDRRLADNTIMLSTLLYLHVTDEHGVQQCTASWARRSFCWPPSASYETRPISFQKMSHDIHHASNIAPFLLLARYVPNVAKEEYMRSV